MSDIVRRLADPFDPSVVSWRVGPTNAAKDKGMALAYIDARDVMRRLDEVCGPENWQNDYPWSDGKRVVCRIGIRIGDEWVWKTDGAGDTDTEGEKGALSDAFKRSAVHWGIGRYLYDTKSPWVAIEQKGKSYVIKESEFARLANSLPRPSSAGRAVTTAVLSDRAPENATRPAATPFDDPPPPPARPQGAPPNPERAKAVESAREAKDRIKAALENARTPKLVDEIVSINGADLKFIKEIHEPAYTALMQFAGARKLEMVAAA